MTTTHTHRYLIHIGAGTFTITDLRTQATYDLRDADEQTLSTVAANIFPAKS